MAKMKKVPAWFIVKDGEQVVGRDTGPFYLQAAAQMRLASFPGATVERRIVEVEESSVMSSNRTREGDW